MIKVSMIGKGALEKAIKGIIKANENPGREFQLVSRRMLKMQRQHFKDQKGPTDISWAPLKAATLAQRRAGKVRKRYGAPIARAILEQGAEAVGIRGPVILRDTGRLVNSLATKSGQTEAIVGTNVKYAATHQFGDEKRKNPARPFLNITTAERKELTRMITDPLI